MFYMTRRNLRIFFRDKTSVFFAFIAVFMMMALYVFFLGDMLADGMPQFGQYSSLLVNYWIMAGLLSVTSITTTTGAFAVLVEDRAKKIMKDFTASPLRRFTLVGGYVLSAFVIGVALSLVAFMVMEGYVVARGGAWLSALQIAKVLGLIVLSVLSSSSMIFFLVSFFRSQKAFSTAASFVSAGIGFVTGIYLPIGSMPPFIAWVIKVFPVSHAVALFRQVLMQGPMEQAFAGSTLAQASFEQEMGVYYQYGTYTAGPLFSVLVLVGTTILFYVLAICNLSRKSR